MQVDPTQTSGLGTLSIVHPKFHSERAKEITNSPFLPEHDNAIRGHIRRHARVIWQVVQTCNPSAENRAYYVETGSWTRRPHWTKETHIRGGSFSGLRGALRVHANEHRDFWERRVHHGLNEQTVAPRDPGMHVCHLS
jgi:hypothetical protein